MERKNIHSCRTLRPAMETGTVCPTTTIGRCLGQSPWTDWIIAIQDINLL